MPHIRPKCLRASVSFILFIFALIAIGNSQQAQPSFRALAFYSESVEPDHVDFAHQAIEFYKAVAKREHFTLVATTDWSQLNPDNLSHYQVILWLNDQPRETRQRDAFEHYMTKGGSWLGFHVSAYNDSDTNWPWFTDFLGGGVFWGNNWPPLPATLVVDEPAHPVNKRMPATFFSPSNEWYIWKPSPRLNKDVKVLLSLAPSNYPIGMKEVITSGDVPVVWTNTRYRMLYVNMGHGNVFSSEIQNKLLENAILWFSPLSAERK